MHFTFVFLATLCCVASGLRDFPHSEEKHYLGSINKFNVLQNEEQSCKPEHIMTPNPLTDPNTQPDNTASVVTDGKKVTVIPTDRFCNMINYPVLIAINGTYSETDIVNKLDANAKQYYDAAVRVLRRFDCRDFYPYKSCDPCKTAYKNWICGVMFPMKCKDKTDARKLCKDVCYEVVRKCPVELQFHCPTDDQSYGDMNPIGGSTFFECNNVGIPRSSGSRTMTGVALLLTAAVALAQML